MLLTILVSSNIIGQSNVIGDRSHTYFDGWTPEAQPKDLTFAQFVTTLGGEYFFAPSLSFFKRLKG